MKQFFSLTFIFICVMIEGCVQVGPKSFPQPEQKPTPKCPPPVVQKSEVAKYDLPGFPQKVTIRIRGDEVEADKGGEEVIRNYVKAQKLLRGETP